MTDARPLAGQPWLRSAASRKVLRALEADGRPARFVGGCVRDGLLGRAAPRADLDLATPERPDAVMRLLAAAGVRALPTGLAHGTVTAMVGAKRFEITTLRRDLATDGRHAKVAFTADFEADAARRDFTINAMSCDRAGRLYDYFGGRDDLAAGRVRFVGTAATRIAEDYLRILRFFRFFAHYGREPTDPEALEACRRAAPEIARLSGERIQTEMLKLIEASDPIPALCLMSRSGVLAEVIPGPVAIDRLARLLTLAPDADPLLRLGALLRPPPADPTVVRSVGERWRLSNRDAARLEAMAGTALPALAASAPEHRRALYRLGPELFADLIRLAAADVGEETMAALAAARAQTELWRSPKLPLSGDDLLIEGLLPGPEVGKILAAVETWWLEQDFAPDRAACLAYARTLIDPPTTNGCAPRAAEIRDRPRRGGA
jgi:poly(A) polymerase